MQNKYFWSLKDYCEYKCREIDKESLYLYLNYSIVDVANPYIYGYVKNLSNKSSSLDIVSDCYLYFEEKDYTDITMINIKNLLANKYRKRYLEIDYSFIMENIEYETDLDTLLFVKEILDSLCQEDREYIKLYFYQGYTYEQIAEVMPLKSKNGVKYKIDTILKKLRDTL